MLLLTALVYESLHCSRVILIHMSIIRIYVMSLVHLPGRPAVVHGKTVEVGYYTQNVQPSYFLPAMLIGTIEFCHVVPQSLTLILAGGTRSAQRKPCFGFIFSDSFSSNQDEVSCADEANQGEHPDTTFG